MSKYTCVYKMYANKRVSVTAMSVTNLSDLALGKL